MAASLLDRGLANWRGVQWLNVLVRGGQVEETFTAEIVAAFERPLTTEEEEALASGGH